MSQFDILRQDARRMEGELDSQMDSLIKLSADLGDGDGGSAADLEAGPLLGEAQMVDRLQDEIKAAIERLASINDEMQQASDGSGKATNMLHRHREILADKQAEFRRTRDKISHQRKTRDLIGSVRKDITSHHESGGMTQLMRERMSIQNSERELDAVLGQALATRETLAKQRDTFGNISDKLRSVAERLPVVQELMGRIQKRKNRDKIILGLTIGGCMCFLVWWTFL